MRSVESKKTSNRSRGVNDEIWADGNGSEIALADLGGLIKVTTTRFQDDASSRSFS